MKINTVTVVGVTGTMGANVAGIFASFGDAKVYCLGRDIEKVKKTIPRIVKSVRADAIAKNLVPADFSMLEDCVRESDLVFESSSENGVKEDSRVDQMEKYSVLMSVYAKVDAEALKLSVGSMVNQTYKPDQIIIVWDGPVGQELRDVVDGYSSQNLGMFTIVDVKDNHGLAYALNAGLKVARNDLVARMDSDDYSLPERCEKQVAEFEKRPDLVLLGTQIKFFKDSIDNILEQTRTFPTDVEEIRAAMPRKNVFSHPTVMFRKSVVLKCGGYNDELRRRQDYELFSKMIVHNKLEGGNLPDTLFLFRGDDEYKRRNRNAESCKNRIKVQKILYKRGDCSLSDYIYVLTAMTVTRLIPDKLYDFIYTKLIWK